MLGIRTNILISTFKIIINIHKKNQLMYQRHKKISKYFKERVKNRWKCMACENQLPKELKEFGYCEVCLARLKKVLKVQEEKPQH